MTIGFDAKRLFHNHTGLGNYSRTLISGLQRYASQIECALYSPNAKKSRYYDAYSHLRIISQDGPLSSAWRSLYQHRDWSGLTHYHGLSHELPYFSGSSPIRKIVTIHDLIQLRYPDDHKLHDRLIYNRKIQRSLDLADRIVCISECTKQDVQEYFQVEEAKLHVVYQSFGEQFLAEISPQVIDAMREKYELPSGYLLFMSGTRPRKNLAGVLRAFAQMSRQSRPPLLLLGNTNEHKKYVSTILGELPTDIHYAHVLGEELPAIYDGAQLVLYPSHYEGFGIPILEAFARQVPVLTSNISSMPEAAGDAAILIDPSHDDAICDGIERGLSDTRLRADLITKGAERLAQFTVQRFVADMVQVYESMA